MELEPDEVLSVVENTAIDDTDFFTELNDMVRNFNERYCACNCVLVLCHRSTKVSFLIGRRTIN